MRIFFRVRNLSRNRAREWSRPEALDKRLLGFVPGRELKVCGEPAVQKMV